NDDDGDDDGDGDDDEEEEEDLIDPEVKEFISNWKEPKSDRPVEELIKETDVWKMSVDERVRLHDFWAKDLLHLYKESYEKTAKLVDEIDNQNRHGILLDRQVIGMTTNGTAKYQSLIQSISPRIIICEEAGEVLE